MNLGNTMEDNDKQFYDLPKDKESGLSLLKIKNPLRTIDDVILSDENSYIIDRILYENHRVETLKSHGLFPSNRLLFCGTTGCGKALSAEVIASELSLPLAIVRIYSSTTSENMRKVFGFIASIPMVVLFDEFDALSKERSDSSQHGELGRSVHDFLQMLDDYDGKSLLIASTIHKGSLDSAILNRFDEILMFNVPNADQIKRLLAIKLKGVRREFDTDKSNISRLFENMSHADVERVLLRSIKEKSLSGKEFLTEHHIQSAKNSDSIRKFMNRGRYL